MSRGARPSRARHSPSPPSPTRFSDSEMSAEHPDGARRRHGSETAPCRDTRAHGSRARHAAGHAPRHDGTLCVARCPRPRLSTPVCRTRHHFACSASKDRVQRPKVARPGPAIKQRRRVTVRPLHGRLAHNPCQYLPVLSVRMHVSFVLFDYIRVLFSRSSQSGSMPPQGCAGPLHSTSG